jgi:hypothetical protein
VYTVFKNNREDFVYTTHILNNRCQYEKIGIGEIMKVIDSIRNESLWP